MSRSRSNSVGSRGSRRGSRRQSPVRVTSRAPSPSRATRSGGTNRADVGIDYVYDRITEATNRLTDITIESFNGTGDIEDWFRRYQDLAVARRWDDAGRKEQLPTFFTGPAGQWLAVRRTTIFSSPSNSGDRRLNQIPWDELTWSQVKKIIIDHYLPDDYRENLRAKLDEKQKPSESLVAFFDRKVYIANRLGRTNGETIKAIKKTLLPEYQKILGVYETYDLEELLVKLKEAGRIIRRVDKPRRADQTQGEETPRRRGGYNNQTNNSGNNSERRNYSCYRCGRPGHIAPNCRAPPHLVDQRRNFTNPRIGLSPGNVGRSYQEQPANYSPGVRNVNHSPPNRTNMPTHQNMSHGPQVPTRNVNNVASEQITHHAINMNDHDHHSEHEAISKQSGSDDSEYLLELKIEGKKVQGLLDTGAGITCIDYAFFRENWPEADLLAPEKLRLMGVGGPAKVQGKARIKYQYIDKVGREQQVELMTAVLEDLSSDLLVGRDFMNIVKATLKLGDHEIICDEPIHSPHVDKPTLAYGRDAVEIPAKSTAVMPVFVKGSNRGLGVVTNHEGSKANIPVANSVVELDGDSILVPITNFGNEKTKFEKGDVVAQFENFEYQAEEFEDEKESSLAFTEKLRPAQLIRGNVPIGVDLTKQQADQLLSILASYDELFSYNGELGDCNVLEHEIDTGDAKPSYSPPYRKSPKVREQVQKQIDEWLSAGVIRPSFSPWASPVVIVPKKDNSMRMCIDLRGVNKLTKRDVYPLPNLDDTLTSLNGAIYFSSLDLNQGYMQIRMAENSIAKTAFISHDGLYEFVRMPFGLTNAPTTFQRCMNIILSGLTYNQCLVYLDDIIVFGSTFENHNRNLVNVLQRIKEANLTIKPSKCAFAVQELRFLGHIVGSEGVRMDPDKISTILQLPAPTTVTEIKSFIGNASYYRRFIRGFSTIVEPLTKLTKKEVPFEWGKAQQEAFEIIKSQMTTQPVLCHYDPKLPLELRTDACGYGLGAILLHEFPDKTKRVIAYASRLLKPAEKNYIISEQECLAVVWAIDKFKHCLQGHHFKVVTDHQALTWLQSKKDLTGRLMRWALALQTYDFEVIYKSGVQHKDVDHLSRNPLPTINRITYGRRGTYRREEDNDEIPEEPVTTSSETPSLQRQEIVDAQFEDPVCQQIISSLPRTKFVLEDGLLLEVNHHNISNRRIVLPESLFSRAMYQIHDSPFSAHGGFRKTLWRFNQRYYIKYGPRKVKKYVQTCHLCQTKKEPWTKRFGMLQSLEAAIRPFQRIGIDTLGPFRRSRNGFEKIIVVTDYMTKWAIVKAIPRENSEEIAQMLLQDVYLRFGAPEVIISDRGKSFNTELMRNLYREFDSRHISSTPYHPQTNGLAERFNRTLAVMLSMFVSNHHRDWDEYLPYVVFAYNTVAQDSTGYAPFYLLHGFQARMVTDIIEHEPETTPIERLEVLHESRELAIEANRRAQIGQKRSYDKNRHLQEFNEGQLVLIHRARGYIGQTTKLRHPYEGPFRVLRRNSDLVYLVALVDRPRHMRRPATELVHVARMKPYYPRQVEENLRTINLLRLQKPRAHGTVMKEQSRERSVLSDTITSDRLMITYDHERGKGGRSKADIPQPRNSSPIRALLSSSLNYMCLLTLVVHLASGRVVWRKTNFRINRGVQDVTLLAHYLLPCSNGTTVYAQKMSKSQLNVTKKFVSWCEDYTSTIVQTHLNLFCSDGGTSLDNHPSKAVLLRNQEKLREANGSEAQPRMGKKKKKGLTRPASTKLKRFKRFILAFLLVSVVVVAIGGAYYVGRSFSAKSHSADIDRLAQQNFDNTKLLASEVREVDKRVDDAFKQINFTISIIGDMKEKLEALEMEASLINQATVASIVFKYQALAADLREISQEWAKGRLHPKFIDVFKLEGNCSAKACPIDLYTPITCNHNAVDQDLHFKLRRQVVRDDVEIVTADAFRYFNIKNLTDNNSDEFWKTNPSRVTVCESSYNGSTHLALTESGCLKRISPATLRDTDVPIVIDECITPKDLKGENTYTSWGCKEMSAVMFDTTSVQLKLDGDHVLIYCPHQYYQLNNGNRTACAKGVIALTKQANITIWRHPFRTGQTPIIEYTYGTINIDSETSFGVPTNIQLIVPETTDTIASAIEQAKNNISQILNTAEREREKYKYNFLKRITSSHHSLLLKILAGIGIAAVLIVALLIVIFITYKLTQPSRPKPSAPQATRVQFTKETPNTSDDEPDEKTPKVRFYDNHAYYTD